MIRCMWYKSLIDGRVRIEFRGNSKDREIVEDPVQWRGDEGLPWMVVMQIQKRR